MRSGADGATKEIDGVSASLAALNAELYEVRVRKAEELLLDEECGVSEIADLLGFENACYFSRIFKKTTGLSPMDYRKGRHRRG